MPPPAPRSTLLHDGACALCARLVSTVRAWDRDGRIECLAYQDASVAARFPALAPADLARELHLVEPDGRVTRGPAAVERLLRLLPHGRPLALLFHLPFAGAVAARVYAAVARNRHRLGCGEHCGARPGGAGRA